LLNIDANKELQMNFRKIKMDKTEFFSQY